MIRAKFLLKLSLLLRNVSTELEKTASKLIAKSEQDFYERCERKARRDRDFAKASIELDDHGHYHYQDLMPDGKPGDTRKHH